MPIPATINTTVDIHRGFNINSPYPASGVLPAAAGVAGHIRHHVRHGRFGQGQYLHWTHVLLLPTETDIRSAYNTQLNTFQSANADTIIVNDYPLAGWRTAFLPVLVQRQGRGTAQDHFRVYLDRCKPLFVKGPFQVGCCADPIPKVLRALLSNFGGCPCVSGVTVTLTHDPATGRWTGSKTICASKPLNLAFYCPGTGTSCIHWRLDITGCVNYTGLLFNSICNCSPLAVWFLVDDFTGSCCSTPGFFNVAVTV